MGGQPVIRSVREDDLEAILGILSNQVGEMYFEEVKQEVTDSVNGKAEGFVAEDKGEIRGYACWRRRVEVAYLETIAVKSEKQGSGTGSILLGEVIRSIKYGHPDIKYLNVVTDNDATGAISFYLKNGFHVSGFVRDELVRDTDQVHLSLDLERY